MKSEARKLRLTKSTAILARESAVAISIRQRLQSDQEFLEPPLIAMAVAHKNFVTRHISILEDTLE
jgi:hypothetical protein